MNDFTSIIIWGVVIAAIFGVLWWRGQIQRLAVYVGETREELKKCTWPNLQELKGSTVVVMVAIGLLGVFTMAVDWVMVLIFFKIL